LLPPRTPPATDNPYISYNCLRTTADEEYAVVGNGTQVDPITEKLELGYPPRDALAESLLALDYEKDDYDTPRIAGVVGAESYVGIVRRDAVLVESVSEPTLVATYEKDTPNPSNSGRPIRRRWRPNSTTSSSNTRSVRPPSRPTARRSRPGSTTASEAPLPVGASDSPLESG